MPSRFILVVDTSPVSWQRVGRAIQGTQCYAMSARSVGEAVGAAAAGDIALVVGSMRLPDGGGYELARRIREERPDTTVLLLDDGPERYDPARGEAAGVWGVIGWPCPVDRLRRHLEAALAPLPLTDPEEPEEPAAPLVELGSDAVTTLPPPAGPPPAGLAADAPIADLVPLVEPLEELGANDLAEVFPDPPTDSGVPGRRPLSELPPTLPPLEDPLPPSPPPRLSAPADERLASFLPRDWKTYPPVRVDPAVVVPAVERALLELLPEVVDTVLRTALATSPALRDLVEVAVDEAVRAQLGPIARSVILERLAELEAASEES